MWSYYGIWGCCITCESNEKMEGCLCYECSCGICSWRKGPYGEGRCTHPSLRPPEGHIDVDLNEAGDIIIVTLVPYIETDIFYFLVNTLKDHNFQYHPEDKTWRKHVKKERWLQTLRTLDVTDYEIYRVDDRLNRLFGQTKILPPTLLNRRRG